MLDKITNHYSFNGVGSVYDEEALTALELSARTAKKVNEVVDAQNKLDKETHDTLDKFENETIPETVKSDVEDHIENGDFEDAIEKHYGLITARVDNLIGHISDAPSSMDAEIIDARVGYDTAKYANVGEYIRTLDKRLERLDWYIVYPSHGTLLSYAPSASGGGVLTFKEPLNLRTPKNEVIVLDWATYGSEVAYTEDGDGVHLTLPSSHSALVYNYTQKKLRFRAGHYNVMNDDVLLFELGYNKPIAGMLLDPMFYEDIKDLEKTVGALSSSAGIFNLPAKVRKHSDHFVNSGKYDSFAFFTDPHLVEEGYMGDFEKFFGNMKKCLDHTRVDLVIGGGDWLKQNDTRTEASEALAMVAGRMESYFGDKYLPILGNHDTNYQGEGVLPNTALRNLLMKGKKNLYYTVETENTLFIVLDTQTDRDGHEDYFAIQKAWVKTVLNSCYRENIVIVAHMWERAEGEVNSLMLEVDKLALAHNDTSTTAGMVRFFLVGHMHEDAVLTSPSGFPIVQTKNFITNANAESGNFDLCFCNWDTNKLYVTRVGSGNDRVVDVTPAKSPTLSGVWNAKSSVDASTFPQEETFEADVTGMAMMSTVKGVQFPHKCANMASAGYATDCFAMAYHEGEVLSVGYSTPMTMAGAQITFTREYTPSPAFYEWWVANFTKEG